VEKVKVDFKGKIKKIKKKEMKVGASGQKGNQIF
jgi:hypothetical protein